MATLVYASKCDVATGAEYGVDSGGELWSTVSMIIIALVVLTSIGLLVTD